MAKIKVEKQKNKRELKHLGLVKVAAREALVAFSDVYKLWVVAVATVIGYVCEKFQHVPHDVLIFLDDKVDEARNKLYERASPRVKQVASQAWTVSEAIISEASRLALTIISKALPPAQTFISEVRTKGVRSVAADAVNKSEQYFSKQAVKTWVALNQVPTFHMVAEMAVPKAAYWSAKYNAAVVSMVSNGYAVFSYIPLVPVDKIATAFKSAKARQ